MPGSIQVSVLDFKDLSYSSIFVKVSLGKIEYQAWNKGDFSFPLTTLHDNLMISLQDADGNQISHAGVRTISIIEKGIWDDLFPLEGGGQIHMKLQFILSEEERNRIRIMRESAIKKREEILKSNLRNSETASISDSKTRAGDVAVKAGHQLSKPDTFNKDAESSNGIKERTIQSQTTPNATDRREETSSSPMSERVEVHQMALVQNIETRSPHFDDPVGPILLQEASETTFVKKKSVHSKLSNDLVEKPNKEEFKAEMSLVKMSEKQLQHADVSTRLQEKASLDVELSKSDIAEKIKSDKQVPPEKTPSNIRKMISAFESSLYQDKGSPIKPLAVKSQTPFRGGGGVVRLLKDQVLKDVIEKSDLSSESLKNPAEPSLGRLKNSFSMGDLQRNPKNLMKTGDFDQDFGGIKQSGQLMESSATKTQSKGMVANVKDKFSSPPKEMNPKEMAKLPKDLTRSSTLETARILEERDSAGNSVVRSEFITAHRETDRKEMETFSGRLHEEKKSAHKETNTKEFVKSPEDLTRASTLEAATFSGRIHEETNSDGNSVVKHEFKSVQRESSTKEILNDFSRESSGTCIFPDDSRRLCTTTEGDKATDLLGRHVLEEKSHQNRNISSVSESIGKDKVQGKSDGEVTQGEEKSHTSRNSSPNSSPEDGSNWPLGQAIKIALVVGFGILVLLTRQREPRKGNKKENDRPGSMEEQLRKIDILKLS